MKNLKVVLLISITAAIIYAVSNSVAVTRTSGSFTLPDSVLKTGDIIFRDGRGAISSIFRHMSVKDQSYSHSGIIHKENNVTYVYHVIGGEGNNAKMKKQLLSEFCDSHEAWAFGVYRTDQDANSIDSVAGSFYKLGIKFDDKFDLATDDKMYCSELVYKVLSRVSQTDNFLPLTTVRNITYCSCDNIFLSPHLKKIYSHSYK